MRADETGDELGLLSWLDMAECVCALDWSELAARVGGRNK